MHGMGSEALSCHVARPCHGKILGAARPQVQLEAMLSPPSTAAPSAHYMRRASVITPSAEPAA